MTTWDQLFFCVTMAQIFGGMDYPQCRMTKNLEHQERIPVVIRPHPHEVAEIVALKVIGLINAKRALGKFAVLGLASGSTPVGVYQELVKAYKAGLVDFTNVITYQLDEYYPMNPSSLQSYHRYMHENLFSHINIPAHQIHIPDGTLDSSKIDDYCLDYERSIAKDGGLDLVLLGIGRSGHIAFNEPGSSNKTRTRCVVLDVKTRRDAAADFFGAENVPRQAITMGVATILEARDVVLMAQGEGKAKIVQKTIENPITHECPASYIQAHPNRCFYLDAAAAENLALERNPWVVADVQKWPKDLAMRAVIWLSQKLNKAILSLDDDDFNENCLQSLVYAQESAENLCQWVFREIMGKIQCARDLPKKKKVLVFSPHPDDDVICMGGMIQALYESGCEVHVAYCTNGSVAVFDADVRRHLDFIKLSSEVMGSKNSETLEKVESITSFLDAKLPGQVDNDDVQHLKAQIRFSEAIAGVRVLGVPSNQCHYLDLPFYKTGTVAKSAIGKADVDIIDALLQDIQPEITFVAGDLSDPHGTHRMCYYAIKEGLTNYVTSEQPADPEAQAIKRAKKIVKNHNVWLYRGSWVEYAIHETDIFFPMSKARLENKIDAIFKHESQKDRAAFPGSDPREFWQRAKDRNVQTAREMDGLGMPQYFAMECFKITTPTEME